VAFEALVNLLAKKPIPVRDGSAALTGLILALTLPPGLPIWICVIGAFVAIVVAKGVFGGLGQNPFNPAMTARVFLLIGFPAPLTRWLVPTSMTGGTMFGQNVTTYDAAGKLVEFGSDKVDAITAATPLGLLAEKGVAAIDQLSTNTDFLWGSINGSLGETSALILLVGGVALLAMRIISWHIPVSYMASVAIFATVTNLIAPDQYAGPLFHLLSGGVILGAWFMATDYVTSPMYPRGKIIFGVGCGVLTMVIRLWAGYPEGVSFAVLLMNALVPILDDQTRPTKFGMRKRVAEKVGA
jgi:electron transport complex protein RnfD